MKSFVQLIFAFLKLLLRSRKDLACENLLLRQQLAVYQRRDKRPPIQDHDRLVLGFLCRIFNDWKSSLLIVKPETVIKWHRKGFKYYWHRKSRRIGRPNIDWELIKLICRLQKENSCWSAQRIQGELTKLDSSLHAKSVSKSPLKSILIESKNRKALS